MSTRRSPAGPGVVGPGHRDRDRDRHGRGHVLDDLPRQITRGHMPARRRSGSAQVISVIIGRVGIGGRRRGRRYRKGRRAVSHATGHYRSCR